MATLNFDAADRFPWNDVAYNGERFVAMGGYSGHPGPSAILYSEDGREWEVARGSDAIPPGISRVVWTGTQFVAVGKRRTGETGEPILRSPDGVRWSAVSGFEDLSFSFLDVAAIGPRLVAVGTDAIYRSDDGGDTWTPASDPGVEDSFSFWGVASGDNRFVAVERDQALRCRFSPASGCASAIAYSDDGDRWTTAREFEFALRDVAWNGERFIAIGANGQILHSRDGQRLDSVPDSPIQEELTAITRTGTYFLAVG